MTYETSYRKHKVVKLLVVSDCLRPCGLWPTRLLRPWDSPGKNTGEGCHFLLQGIFQTQGSNSDLPHCRQILYHLSHQGSALIGTLGTSILSLSVTLAQETAKLKNKNSKPKFFRCWHSCKLANRSLLVSVFSFDQRNLLLIWQMNQTFN